MTQLSAYVILAALAVKHAGDTFVPECKDGPTWTRTHRRLDAWVLLKTWSPVTAIGYEIKVSRSDFLRDQKTDEYLPLCHQLYFVAPKGLIYPQELPKSVGLIEALGAGRRLITRRKAVRREIPLPSDLMAYVLMSRARIAREQTGDREARMDALRRWTEEAEARDDLGKLVHATIRRRFDEQAKRQRNLERRLDELEAVRRRLVELGFDPEQHVDQWSVGRRLAEIRSVVTPEVLRELGYAEQRLAEVRRDLERLAARPQGEAA